MLFRSLINIHLRALSVSFTKEVPQVRVVCKQKKGRGNGQGTEGKMDWGSSDHTFLFEVRMIDNYSFTIPFFDEVSQCVTQIPRIEWLSVVSNLKCLHVHQIFISLRIKCKFHLRWRFYRHVHTPQQSKNVFFDQAVFDCRSFNMQSVTCVPIPKI